MAQDFLIECGNPKAFDAIIQQLGGLLEQDSAGEYVIYEGRYYRMRALGDAGFLQFAVTNQGYCKIIKPIQ